MTGRKVDEDMHRLYLFDSRLVIDIPISEWWFLCEKRFFTDEPEDELIEAEFVTGTGITSDSTQLWNEASQRFLDYIADLREIQKLDLNAMCMDVAKERA